MTNKEIYHLAGMINKSCQTRLFDKYDKLCEGCMFELKDNDLNIKVRKMRGFLNDGDRVKILIIFQKDSNIYLMKLMTKNIR